MDLEELLQGNSYPGRGIVVGQTLDDKAVFAYFIMGRSVNSRNRVFEEKGQDVFTKPFEGNLVVDPSLIIYRAVATMEDAIVVTNGDQTDTIIRGLKEGKDFSQALESREYEPDGPNYTPRISAILHFAPCFRYELSILKREGGLCVRPHWNYVPEAGTGHILHTYAHDDAIALPSFMGEPRKIALSGDAPSLAKRIWDALDGQNKIALVVRTIGLENRKTEQVVYNRNTR
ncbi:MAG: IMP cyclohydrolase [Sphaerochaetaceae bacterium]